MKPLHAFVVAGAIVLAPLAANPAAAQTPSAVEKLNAYVGCINRLSARAYDSRARYFSWAAKSGPTGHERIIYGLYTIYDTTDCRNNVEKANALEPHDAELEAAATAYAKAATKLELLLKEADDYYTQQDYKDDKMAKGKALHPLLVAAWDDFESADKNLRGGVETINDKRALEKLAAIEQSEGRQARYHVEALMIQAKRVLRAEDSGKPDLAAITQALADYESIVKAAEQFTRLRRRRQDRIVFHEQRQVVFGHGEGPDAPHPRSCAVQFRRQDDARQRRQRLDGRGLAAAAITRLQSAGRQLQSRRQHLARGNERRVG